MTYLNSTGQTFVEQEGAQLTIDAWGLDTIVRKWRGKVACVPEFIATIRKNRNAPDATYNALTLTNYTINHGKAWADVDITYKGTFDGKLPDPVFSGGTATLGVQLTLKDLDTERIATAFGREYTAPSTDLQYKAPFASVKYVTREKPTTARFAHELNGIEPFVQIVNQGGHRGPVSVVPLSQPRIANIPVYYAVNPATGLLEAGAVEEKNGFFNSISNIVNEGPTYSQEGKYYLCEEKNQVTLMPFSFAAMRWSINLNQVSA